MFERTRTLWRRLTQVDTSSSTAQLEDRRSTQRHTINLETVCRLVGDDSPLHCVVRNISRTGINLLVGQEIPEGKMLRIDLPSETGHPATVVLACVMHAAPMGESWSLGCMLSLELSVDDLRLFGGDKELAGGQDQRAWNRYPADGKACFRVLSDSNSQMIEAKLLNISPAGVGLVVDDRIEPGVVVSLDLHRNTGKPDLSILACVVYLSERDEGDWVVGCNFIRELQDREMKTLI